MLDVSFDLELSIIFEYECNSTYKIFYNFYVIVCPTKEISAGFIIASRKSTYLMNFKLNLHRDVHRNVCLTSIYIYSKHDFIEIFPIMKIINHFKLKNYEL